MYERNRKVYEQYLRCFYFTALECFGFCLGETKFTVYVILIGRFP